MDTPRTRTLVDLKTGPLIQEARRMASISQSELAERLGTTQSAVSRWERGHDEPRLSRLAAILSACGLRATLGFAAGEDVDRAQIRQQLALSPEDRLASVTNVSRLVAGARRA